ncbi:glucose-6-phosphate isomerase [Amycolatopsis mediterranei S699]|uniref:Glucose-6-phosphate isomerase n=2 Tax=Amycolatopsis mediterranei TaxID=33910 RepID=A0A0H3D305_AMYMU|nr:glucose-6-phosphate isomerase [Amycolatopsis mediterranei]ADJ44602.1 glucose-6-phosphate isomerase [Amycolatopsis mediterranei U32]AEK41341.1 glucose-6-phosphate isomerase [Amycolatopsis mediterranei S699]AFO76315.1 glucose-6-phosphate isomerase [Amycolatopsis mediterranei S699]AGT83444.1 glucose-6-phosphate isomerase [Amycolatopsis mediterranei RB]KDO07040.1 glucose-6-phosphate isomerase [Amycolatopsis mediterranei]
MTTGEKTGVEIVDAALAERAAPLAEQLVDDQAASKLAAQDATLWGPDAESEASIRLSWTTLHKSSRPLIGEIEALRTELRSEGVDRVVLAGMGGSSLAPEVITGTDGVALTVLDTTDPGQVADALAGDLERTVIVVSSKSGGTVETDSHRRIFAKAFADAGIDAARRIVVVTDPGSPFQELSEKEGYRKVFLADPHVGGRYSALTAFGLVPAGLAGADVARLLDQAASVADELAADSADNPAVKLAAAWAAAHETGAEKVVLADTGSGIKGFPDWAEQLIAESTGKQGTGLLPVAVEGPEAPGFADAKSDATPTAVGGPQGAAKIAVTGSLGAQFLLWEFATALAGRLLGINPFDQPDVETAKKAARALLDAPEKLKGGEEPSNVDGPVEIFGSDGVSTDGSLTDVLRAFFASAPDAGYIAVQAYLDRLDDASTAVLRGEIAKRTGKQTTFGWGPRFLHSTGQYHKGGHQNGVFLQLTGAVEQDLDVPDRPYTLGQLQHAQALGDGQVLAEHGRPVLRLHLTDRAAGLAAVVRAVQEAGA